MLVALNAVATSQAVCQVCGWHRASSTPPHYSCRQSVTPLGQELRPAVGRRPVVLAGRRPLWCRLQWES